MRLVDGNALYEKAAEWEAQALHMVEKTMNDEDATEWKRWSIILTERSAFKFDVADAPTVDAVPVVRCRDCKHGKQMKDGYYTCFWLTVLTGEDWYCCHGERRDE